MDTQDYRMKVERPVYEQEQLNKAYDYNQPITSRMLTAMLNSLVLMPTVAAAVRSTCRSWRPGRFLFQAFPVLHWMGHYRWKEDFVNDLVAGFTVAVMHIPQALVFTALSPTNPRSYSPCSYSPYSYSAPTAHSPTALASTNLTPLQHLLAPTAHVPTALAHTAHAPIALVHTDLDPTDLALSTLAPTALAPTAHSPTALASTKLTPLQHLLPPQPFSLPAPHPPNVPVHIRA
uniref:SLC26A/SulP transporter domain-containing protein n=1 Tax=Timema bartmani TaxID=61472 RepID=A0A7R9I6U1_9NEOP|nr:unnamed protein product [Timema bartmani]